VQDRRPASGVARRDVGHDPDRLEHGVIGHGQQVIRRVRHKLAQLGALALAQQFVRVHVIEQQD